VGEDRAGGGSGGTAGAAQKAQGLWNQRAFNLGIVQQRRSDTCPGPSGLSGPR
jgi:hypothetical protein